MEDIPGRLARESEPGFQQPQSPKSPSPAQKLQKAIKRSKSVFGLAQDFLKLKIGVSLEGFASEPQVENGRSGAWSAFASIRGSKRKLARDFNTVSATTAEQWKNQTTIVDENGRLQPRRRKSLHDLIGSVGNRYSIHGKRRALGDIVRQTIEENTGDYDYPGDVGPTSANDRSAQTSRLPMQGPRNDIQQNGKEASEQPSMAEAATTSNSDEDDYSGCPNCSSRHPSSMNLVFYSFTTRERKVAEDSGNTSKNHPQDQNGSRVESSLAKGRVSRESDKKSDCVPTYDEIIDGSKAIPKMNLDPLFLERFHDRHARYDDLLQPSLERRKNYAQKRIITLVAARMSDNMHLLDGGVATVLKGCSTRIKPGKLSPHLHSAPSNPFSCHPRRLSQDWSNDVLEQTCTLRRRIVSSAKVEGSHLIPGRHMTKKKRAKSPCMAPEDLVIYKRSGHGLQPGIAASVPKSEQVCRTERQKEILKKVALKRALRQASQGPFHIRLPQTEFSSGYAKSYTSKKEAFADLYEIHADSSDYENFCLIDKASNTIYPQVKGSISEVPRADNSSIEYFWLPMKYGCPRLPSTTSSLTMPEHGQYSNLHLTSYGDSRRLSSSDCKSLGPKAQATEASNQECLAYGSLLQIASKQTKNDKSLRTNVALSDLQRASDHRAFSQISSTRSRSRSASSDSFLDLYLSAEEAHDFDWEDKKPDTIDHYISNVRRRDISGSSKESQREQPSRPDSAISLLCNVDDLELEMAEGTRTWASLETDFLNKYAPFKRDNKEIRQEQAVYNSLLIRGGPTSVVKKIWSRDRNGSDDVSFDNIEELARYEAMKEESERRWKAQFGPDIPMRASACDFGSSDFGIGSPAISECGSVVAEGPGFLAANTNARSLGIIRQDENEPITTSRMPATPNLQFALQQKTPLDRIQQNVDEVQERIAMDARRIGTACDSVSQKAVVALPALRGAFASGSHHCRESLPYLEPLPEMASEVAETDRAIGRKERCKDCDPGDASDDDAEPNVFFLELEDVEPEIQESSALENPSATKNITSSHQNFSECATEVDDSFGEPLERCNSETENKMDKEERHWRDFMLYG